jgi:hypothetical protein
MAFKPLWLGVLSRWTEKANPNVLSGKQCLKDVAIYLISNQSDWFEAKVCLLDKFIVLPNADNLVVYIQWELFAALTDNERACITTFHS